MNNPYYAFVEIFENALREGASMPPGGFAPDLQKPDLAADAPKVLIFSPHPDDESITGGITLRMLRELKMRVINVAVTQGSKKERQAARFKELTDACDYLGFEVIQTREGGMEKINPKGRQGDPDNWNACVERTVEILKEHNPKVVFVPHDADWNSTHIGTHLLVMDALKKLPEDLECYILQCEFWAPMGNPNLMIESSLRDAADLVAAIAFHVEEVRRNPYHTRLPAWLQDNVRRGGELVGGQGGAVPDFTFATLYRLDKWSGHQLTPTFEGGQFISAQDSLAGLFE
ncbi:MAG: PIG-L family deacetylase [Armatimonadetes bacterium]|nr:PIG-L family deacetylase [Armatimonadota bacterium]